MKKIMIILMVCVLVLGIAAVQGALEEKEKKAPPDIPLPQNPEKTIDYDNGKKFIKEKGGKTAYLDKGPGKVKFKIDATCKIDEIGDFKQTKEWGCGVVGDAGIGRVSVPVRAVTACL